MLIEALLWALSQRCRQSSLQATNLHALLVCLNLGASIRADTGDRHSKFCCLCYDLQPHFCTLVKPFSPCSSLPCLPLVISMMHGSRPSSEYLRWWIKFIPAVALPAEGARLAHHRAFYKHKQHPVVLFHRLTLHTPPLCALFVSDNTPIQQQRYKPECQNEKERLLQTFWTKLLYLHCVYDFFLSLLVSIAVLLALQIAVPVKMSDFITTLIREVAFNIVSVMTSRPSVEHMACSLHREPKAKARGGLRRPGPGAQRLQPALHRGQGVLQHHSQCCLCCYHI